MDLSKNRPAAHSFLVTGAEGALGSEVIAALLESGAKRVYATYLHAEPRHLSTLQGHSAVEWLQVDVTHSDSVKRVIAPLQVDGLVHCAGGFRYSTVEEVTDGDLDLLLSLNLKSAFLLARALVPGMKARNFGRMVFISAKATLAPGAGMGPYTASKIGLNALTLALAEELKAYDINVNAVLPSIIDTPANRKDMPQADFSKWVTPQALAKFIVSLTQNGSQPVHGALIPVSGRV